MSHPLKQQIIDARRVLDETHVDMGGTGKRIALLEGLLREARSAYFELDGNKVSDALKLADLNRRIEAELKGGK